MSEDLIFRLKERARIRRQISSRKSVQEGKPDRIADLLEEAASALEEAGSIMVKQQDLLVQCMLSRVKDSD